MAPIIYYLSDFPGILAKNFCKPICLSKRKIIITEPGAGAEQSIRTIPAEISIWILIGLWSKLQLTMPVSDCCL